MTGEEGTKVVSNNSASNNSLGALDLSTVTDSTSTGSAGVVNLHRGENNSSSVLSGVVTNGQLPEADISSGDFPLTSDLSTNAKAVGATAASNINNNGKNFKSSGVADLVDSGEFDGTNSTINSLEVSNNSNPQNQSPQKRNGRTESGTFSQKDDSLTEYPFISDEDLLTVPREQLVQSYHDIKQDYHSLKKYCTQLKESDEKMRLQQLESSRRENVLVMRLTSKEQEVQEYVAQLNELKSAVAPSPGSLRSTLLDPAVNFIIQRMKKEMDETKKKLEDTQNDLNAWKFTPDSNTGKRLMAKCRMLYQENEDLGKMITSGRVAKLESDFALQTSLTEEMKKSQSELDELIQELDEDVEGMQSTIYYLQQQLRESKEKVGNTSSNPLTSSNNNSEEFAVIVSELCAQCRAFQQEKKEQQQQRNNSSPGPSHNLKSLKMEIDGEESNLRIDDNDDNDDERTCVNGEADLSRSDTEESESEGRKRTSKKSKHSKDTTNIIDSDSKKIVVQKNGSEVAERRIMNKFKLDKPTDEDCEEEEKAMDFSYTSSPPPTKRTKLANANHSSSAAASTNI